MTFYEMSIQIQSTSAPSLRRYWPNRAFGIQCMSPQRCDGRWFDAMLSSRFEFALVSDVVSSWFDFICQSISSAIMADILDEIFVVLRPVHHAMTTKFPLSSSERLALFYSVHAALAASSHGQSTSLAYKQMPGFRHRPKLTRQKARRQQLRSGRFPNVAKSNTKAGEEAKQRGSKQSSLKWRTRLDVWPAKLTFHFFSDHPQAHPHWFFNWWKLAKKHVEIMDRAQRSYLYLPNPSNGPLRRRVWEYLEPGFSEDEAPKKEDNLELVWSRATTR